MADEGRALSRGAQKRLKADQRSASRRPRYSKLNCLWWVYFFPSHSQSRGRSLSVPRDQAGLKDKEVLVCLSCLLRLTGRFRLLGHQESAEASRQVSKAVIIMSKYARLFCSYWIMYLNRTQSQGRTGEADRKHGICSVYYWHRRLALSVYLHFSFFHLPTKCFVAMMNQIRRLSHMLF